MVVQHDYSFVRPIRTIPGLLDLMQASTSATSDSVPSAMGTLKLKQAKEGGCAGVSSLTSSLQAKFPGGIRYVGFLSSTTFNYAAKMKVRAGASSGKKKKRYPRAHARANKRVRVRMSLRLILTAPPLH